MDIPALIRCQTHFSLNFSNKALEVNVKKNVVFSPVSISVVLSLAGGGTKGATLDQFCNCLKSKDIHQLNELSFHLINAILMDGSASGGPLLSFVNGVWVEQSFTLKPNYRDIVNNRYNAEANSANEIRMEVNKWAENESKGKIEEFLSPDSVDEDTRLILANALYFKGRWEDIFDFSATEEGTFNLPNGESVQVPMMTTTENQFIKIVDDCKILRLPYFQGQDNRSFSMYIILPNDINGLPELERKVDLNFLEHHLSQGSKVKVRYFQLPRFKISSSVNATDILKTMGLVLPFTIHANFDDMVEFYEGERLCITNVFHKSFVEVNEVGTEATAISTITYKQMCARMYPIEDFIADHPFMFVIKEDKTGVILFVGHVLNPLES
ncbi:serpin-ZX-like [Cryptomeria japonica]|uniref:serpin-ZX-like n=1 Tax=Cryptomeria japonica TaxID=3369 RepID=UPI0027D9EE83|nr:serpin-ZX-like [Cryptomeria japonica]